MRCIVFCSRPDSCLGGLIINGMVKCRNGRYTWSPQCFMAVAASMLVFVSGAQVEKVSSAALQHPCTISSSNTGMALATMAGAKPTFKGSLEKEPTSPLGLNGKCVLTMAVRH